MLNPNAPHADICKINRLERARKDLYSLVNDSKSRLDIEKDKNILDQETTIKMIIKDMKRISNAYDELFNEVR